VSAPATPLPGKVLAALLLQTAFAAGTYLAAKRATASFEPQVLVTLRLLASGTLFAALLAARRQWPRRADWGWLLLFGFLGGPVNQGLFLAGLSRSQASHGGLLYALTPAGVYLLGLALGRERFQPRRAVGIALAFAGVGALMVGRGLDVSAGPLVGDLLILGAVAAWVAVTTESRPFATEHGGFQTAGWLLVAGGLWAVPAAPWVVPWGRLGAVDAVGWACLAYLVLFTSIASYVLWNYALSRVEASRVAVFSNLQPVATAALAWGLLGEALTLDFLLGTALVLAGVRLAQRP
jgi:drug/metabolite transporter (DMT)-like permease